MNAASLAATSIYALILAAAVTAQPVSLTGRVVDDSIKPVSGVAVTLSGAKLSATTDAQGRFTLANSTVRSSSRESAAFSSSIIAGGRLLLTIPEGGRRLRVDVYDASGAKMATAFDGERQAGVCTLDPLPSLRSEAAASGALVIRVTIGADVRTHLAMRLENAAACRTTASAVAPALAKSAATAAVVDSLSLVKTSYASANVVVESYAGDLGDIVVSGTTGYPHVVLTNGTLRIMVYLPNAQSGYYRSARFDWTGIVGRAWLNGHTFFADWKVPHSPDDPEGGIGPVQEFDIDVPPGYASAAVGGPFVKIGVGQLTRFDANAYFFNFAYTIADHGTMRVTRANRWIEFQHDIPAVGSIDYSYTKRLAITGDSLLMAHTLRNTGTSNLLDTVYSHNFTRFDDRLVAADYKVTLGFTPTGFSGGSLATQQGNVITVSGAMGGNTLWTVLGGYSNAASQNWARIENTTSKTSLTILGDHPLSKCQLYATQYAFCFEPFITLTTAAGQTSQWTHTLVFVSN